MGGGGKAKRPTGESSRDCFGRLPEESIVYRVSEGEVCANDKHVWPVGAWKAGKAAGRRGVGKAAGPRVRCASDPRDLSAQKSTKRPAAHRSLGVGGRGVSCKGVERRSPTELTITPARSYNTIWYYYYVVYYTRGNPKESKVWRDSDGTIL